VSSKQATAPLVDEMTTRAFMRKRKGYISDLFIAMMQLLAQ
jgi:hypothetical protein